MRDDLYNRKINEKPNLSFPLDNCLEHVGIDRGGWSCLSREATCVTHLYIILIFFKRIHRNNSFSQRRNYILKFVVIIYI